MVLKGGINRSSRTQGFLEAGVLNNLLKFRRKQLCRSFFQIELQAFNFIQKKTPTQLNVQLIVNRLRPFEFCKNLKNTSRQLLLILFTDRFGAVLFTP